MHLFLYFFLQSYSLLTMLFCAATAIAAIAGGVQAATVRSDAFTVADRKPKPVWIAILAVCAVILAISARFSAIGTFAWIAAVIVGIYWFDVYPQIRDLLSGNGGGY